MSTSDIDRLIQLLAKLPGLGPRSARRAALALVKKREGLLLPLGQTMRDVAETTKTCEVCGNLDSQSPCGICLGHKRDKSLVCVIEDVSDLWAMERMGTFRGHYHVLGGTLSALDGVGPEDLNIPKLYERTASGEITEVVLALSATVDGQTTSHYIAEGLKLRGILVSGIAHGVPVGGELDYLDDGTLSAALRERRPL